LGVPRYVQGAVRRSGARFDAAWASKRGTAGTRGSGRVGSRGGGGETADDDNEDDDEDDREGKRPITITITSGSGRWSPVAGGRWPGRRETADDDDEDDDEDDREGKRPITITRKNRDAPYFPLPRTVAPGYGLRRLDAALALPGAIGRPPARGRVL